MPHHLGQHFLNNPTIVDKIVNSSLIKKSDTIIEIGPGEGILTEKLCQKSNRVIAIELDNNLEIALRNRFKQEKNLEIIFEDILKINLPQLLKDRNIKEYKVIANIPYYITSKIIRLFLETVQQPKELVLMIQKEVAHRIVAPKGKMSILSVSVQYYAQAEILFDVTKENFNPAPKVDSSVIRIFDINKDNNLEKKLFFKTVRAGFCARRKTLVNNLSNSFHLDKEVLIEIFDKISLPQNIRAQDLSIDDWKNLSNSLKNKVN